MALTWKDSTFAGLMVLLGLFAFIGMGFVFSWFVYQIYLVVTMIVPLSIIVIGLYLFFQSKKDKK